MSWWQIMLCALGFGVWSITMVLLGAAIVKSSYTVPSDPRSLQ